MTALVQPLEDEGNMKCAQISLQSGGFDQPTDQTAETWRRGHLQAAADDPKAFPLAVRCPMGSVLQSCSIALAALRVRTQYGNKTAPHSSPNCIPTLIGRVGNFRDVPFGCRRLSACHLRDGRPCACDIGDARRLSLAGQRRDSQDIAGAALLCCCCHSGQH